jgi:hypothetical protein
VIAFLLFACAADTTGPATPGTVLDKESQTAAQILALSDAIGTEAAALQKLVADAREKQLTPEERKALSAELDTRMKALAAKDAELQAVVKDVELRISGGVDPHDRTPGMDEKPKKQPQ